MITKQQLIDSMLWEIRIIRHLGTKLPQGSARYRPTSGQRSMLELMQYLTTCAIVPATAAVNDNWDHAEEREKAADNVTPLNFDRAMAEQARQLKALVNGISSNDFAHKTAHQPWGTPVPLGQAIMDMALKPLVAYRMQFFLYLKSAGSAELGGAQCWVGVDPRPRPESA